MAAIVLTTYTATYAHTAFGLRYLLSNLGELTERTVLLELHTGQRPEDAVERVLELQPAIVGVSVHIWNVQQCTQLVRLIKCVAPQVVVVVGGPEVSHETDAQEIVVLSDYVIKGEGEVSFPKLCEALLAGRPPAAKVITGETPDLATIALPYAGYTAEDLAHRVLYVEASRGCPFRCAFCLSALDASVRRLPVTRVLSELDALLCRGARRFKFVDRTFNLHTDDALTILSFFIERHVPGLFLHFEVVPDRLPSALREALAAFPEGALQLEVGVQTLNPDVAERILRRHDASCLAANIRFLRQQTHAHLHTDLVVGLPGETLESFASGFDELFRLGPQEVQVGILKRLRGTPIVGLSDAYGMVYNPQPPYELLQNHDLDFSTLQRLKRFARFWDLVVNRGRFRETAPLIWADGSPFHAFLRCSEWLFARTGQTHSISLERLARLLLEYLTVERFFDRRAVVSCLRDDYQRGGNRRLPGFLAEATGEPSQRPISPSQTHLQTLPPRQRQHLV